MQYKIMEESNAPACVPKKKRRKKRESGLQGPDLFASLFGCALPTCGVVTFVIS